MTQFVAGDKAKFVSSAEPIGSSGMYLIPGDIVTVIEHEPDDSDVTIEFLDSYVGRVSAESLEWLES